MSTFAPGSTRRAIGLIDPVELAFALQLLRSSLTGLEHPRIVRVRIEPVVLAQAIYREGAKNVVAGANPMELKRGIDQAVEVVLELAVNIWRSRDKGGFSEVVGAEGGGAIRAVAGLTKQQQATLENLRNELFQIWL